MEPEIIFQDSFAKQDDLRQIISKCLQNHNITTNDTRAVSVSQNNQELTGFADLDNTFIIQVQHDPWNSNYKGKFLKLSDADIEYNITCMISRYKLNYTNPYDSIGRIIHFFTSSKILLLAQGLYDPRLLIPSLIFNHLFSRKLRQNDIQADEYTLRKFPRMIPQARNFYEVVKNANSTWIPKTSIFINNLIGGNIYPSYESRMDILKRISKD